MSQSTGRLVGNNSGRVVAWLLSLWIVTGCLLWSIWPVRPRLILSSGEAFRIVGITPDSRSVVARSRRTKLQSRDSTAVADAEGVYRDTESLWSGPIQVWDLQTGQVRSIGLPGQSNEGLVIPTNGDFEPARIDPDAWIVTCPAEPFRDRRLRLVQTNRDDERWSVTVDLDAGTTTRVRMPDCSVQNLWHTAPSKTGRWCLDQLPIEGTENPHHQRLRVLDTTSSESVVIDFQALNGIDNHCFSEDETQFAFSASLDRNDSEQGTTQVWQLQPPKLLKIFDRSLGGMAYSPDKKWIASADYAGVEVLEIETGRVLHQFPVEGVGLRKPVFTADGVQLLAYDYLRGGAGGVPPFHCVISEVHAWNLQTGGHLKYLQQEHRDFFDPNFCEDGWGDQTTPRIVGDDGHAARLFDVLTGQTVFSIPKGTTVEVLSPSGRTVILLRRLESRFNKVLDQLQKWNIPIPGFLWQHRERGELLVCDVPTGRVRGRLPFDDLWITREKLVLSPDERTLVTTADDPGSGVPVVSVWDCPPHTPVQGPLVWSLLAPLALMLWRGWRGRRNRPRPDNTESFHRTD
ncbi:MAG: WD40 repeat domain-containing protein [Planctomycetales bacterium]|nr:WD40 repeat domain-containing protein [Planctomycetales bacterium]